MNTTEISTKEDISRLEMKLDRMERLIESVLSPVKQKPFLSGSEVKEMLGISEGTLKAYRAKGWLPGKKKGGKYFYRYEDVMKLLG